MIRTGLIGALVVAIIAWIAWPYYALYDLAVAVQQGDVLTLVKRVEWDSVRQGLRSDLKRAFVRKLTSDKKSDNAGGALGAGLALILAPTFIDQIIDSYVTPEFVATINHDNRTNAAPVADKPSHRRRSASGGYFWQA